MILTTEQHSLVRIINDREDAIQSMRKRTVESVNGTSCEVLLQGQDLIKAKSLLLHGKWIPWLSVYCPNVGARQAQKYMRVAAANANRGSFLEEADSLRQALALCEASDEGETKEPQRPPAYIEANRRLHNLVAFIEKSPPDKWPQPAQERLRVQLEPLARSIWPDRFNTESVEIRTI